MKVFQITSFREKENKNLALTQNFFMRLVNWEKNWIVAGTTIFSRDKQEVKSEVLIYLFLWTGRPLLWDLILRELKMITYENSVSSWEKNHCCFTSTRRALHATVYQVQSLETPGSRTNPLPLDSPSSLWPSSSPHL
jgi:hypothetical protein